MSWERLWCPVGLDGSSSRGPLPCHTSPSSLPMLVARTTSPEAWECPRRPSPLPPQSSPIPQSPDLGCEGACPSTHAPVAVLQRSSRAPHRWLRPAEPVAMVTSAGQTTRAARTDIIRGSPTAAGGQRPEQRDVSGPRMAPGKGDRRLAASRTGPCATAAHELQQRILGHDAVAF